MFNGLLNNHDNTAYVLGENSNNTRAINQV